MHHRVSSAVTAERERTCSPIPIEYPVQPPCDLSAAMLDRHSDFRYQRELNTWQSRYNFLQKHYDTQKERLAQLTASHERLKKQLTQSLRATRKHELQSVGNANNRSSVEIYQRQSEKGELVVLRRQNMHLQQSVSGYRRQLKESRQRNQQLQDVVRSQQQLIDKLKQNLMMAVQNNTEEVQLVPYNIRIPKYEMLSPKAKEVD